MRRSGDGPPALLRTRRDLQVHHLPLHLCSRLRWVRCTVQRQRRVLRRPHLRRRHLLSDLRQSDRPDLLSVRLGLHKYRRLPLHDQRSAAVRKKPYLLRGRRDV